MTQYAELVKRNMRLYLRDKGAVFFSLLSMLIIIAVSMLFLGDINAETLADMLSSIPNRDRSADKANAKLFFLLWTVGGIISINAITVTVAVYSNMIKDKTDGILGAISTCPVKRGAICASYITSAFLCSVIICILTLAISEIYCIIQGAEPLSLKAHIELLFYIILNSFSYSAITYFIASVVKTQGAWSGIGTVIGTLVGFLGGIYIPLGSLAEGLASFLKCLPVIYGVTMFRKTMLSDISSELFDGVGDEIRAECLNTLGVEFEVFSTPVTIGHCILALFLWGAAFLILSIIISNKKR